MSYNHFGDVMSSKTNAIRLVQNAGFPCKEFLYDYDENDLSGIHAAEATGLPASQVFKTLVARGLRTGINVFCIPVSASLDLKKAAKAAGDKNMEMVQVKELLSFTGYIRGGCSPIGMKRKYPTYVDLSAHHYGEIAVSAGERGHQMLIPVLALVQLVNAQLSDLT